MIAKDTPMELRPLDYGGILDRTLELYKQNFSLFVSISALLYVPIALFSVFMVTFLVSTHSGLAAVAISLGPALLGLASLLVQSMLTVAVSRRYLGLQTSIGDCFAAISPIFGTLVITLIMSWLLVMAGFVMLVIPGIIFMFWIVFVSQAVVLEGKSYGAAITRSRELIAGEWGRVVVLGLLAGLLGWAAQMAVGAVFGILPVGGTLVGHHIVTALAQAVANTLAYPISITAFIVLYYDIRVRKEAFDLQMLASHLGVAAPAAGGPAADVPSDR